MQLLVFDIFGPSFSLARRVHFSLSFLALAACSQVSFSLGLALAALARVNLGVGGKLWRARVLRGKFPCAPCPPKSAAYNYPPCPSLSSSPLPIPLPLRYWRRW
jgi:hypothetical protein